MSIDLFHRNILNFYILFYRIAQQLVGGAIALTGIITITVVVHITPGIREKHMTHNMTMTNVYIKSILYEEDTPDACVAHHFPQFNCSDRHSPFRVPGCLPSWV